MAASKTVRLTCSPFDICTLKWRRVLQRSHRKLYEKQLAVTIHPSLQCAQVACSIFTFHRYISSFERKKKRSFYASDA